MKTPINSTLALTIFVASYFIGLVGLIYTLTGMFGIYAILPTMAVVGFVSWAMVRK